MEVRVTHAMETLRADLALAALLVGLNQIYPFWGPDHSKIAYHLGPALLLAPIAGVCAWLLPPRADVPQYSVKWLINAFPHLVFFSGLGLRWPIHWVEVCLMLGFYIAVIGTLAIFFPDRQASARQDGTSAP